MEVCGLVCLVHRRKIVCVVSHVRGRSKTVSKSSGKNGALKSNNNRGGERGATKRGSNGNNHIGKVNHIGIPYWIYSPYWTQYGMIPFGDSILENFPFWVTILGPIWHQCCQYGKVSSPVIRSNNSCNAFRFCKDMACKFLYALRLILTTFYIIKHH